MSNPLTDALRQPWALRLARIAIGCVFLAAALGKIGDPSAFALQVHNFRLAPVWSENLVAIVLPWVELVAGLALVVGIRARAGAVIVLVLMVLFTAVVGVAWARGLDFECGCFGKAVAGKVGGQKFFENLGLTALAAIASLQGRQRRESWADAAAGRSEPAMGEVGPG